MFRGTCKSRPPIRDSSSGRDNEIVQMLSAEFAVERRQPLRLRRRILRVRREKVDAWSAGLELRLDERVQLGMRQLRDDLDAVAGRVFEGRDGLVQRIVHRAAHQRRPDYAHRIACAYPFHPPSIMNADPVTNAASSLARYNTAAAISSGRPIRPTAWVEDIC